MPFSIHTHATREIDPEKSLKLKSLVSIRIGLCSRDDDDLLEIFKAQVLHDGIRRDGEMKAREQEHTFLRRRSETESKRQEHMLEMVMMLFMCDSNKFFVVKTTITRSQM